MRPESLALAVLLAAVAIPSPPAAAGGCAARAPEAQAAVAERALARGDWPRAAAAFACATAMSDDARLAERATRSALENDQMGPAARSAGRWVTLEPDSEEARRHLATALLRLYRSDESTGHFAVVLETAWQDRAEGYSALGTTLARESNKTGAARVMEHLVQGDAGLAEAQLARSVLWEQAEHGARALQAARRALELRPGWRPAELAEVRALLLLGRTEEGIGRAGQLALGGDALSKLSLAWWLVGAGRDEQAREAFEDLRKSGNAVPQALEGLGSLAWSRRDYEGAKRYFTELAQLSRGDPASLAFLGLLAEKENDPQLAVRLLERVTSGPRAVASQLRAYRLNVELGMPERAEQGLGDFLEQSPESTRDVVLGLAGQLVDLDRGAQAMALLDRAADRYPEDGDLQLGRAYLLERLDRVPEAVAVMRDVLRRRPGDPTALNALGYTLADRTDRIAEGYRLVRRAIEARPDSYAVMDSMGWALFRLRRPLESLPWLERAWERSRDPEVAAHLGEVLWAQGRREEARRLWTDAQQDSPDNRSLQRTVARHQG